MPDFFVPGIEYDTSVNTERKQSRVAIKESDLRAIANEVQNIINPEMIKNIGALYSFNLIGIILRCFSIIFLACISIYKFLFKVII